MIERDAKWVLKRSDVVRDEIDGAIRLVLAGNYVGAHVLASAALRVLTDVATHEKIETYHRALQDLVLPIRKAELLSKLNGAYNFMKHADRDPEKEFEGYSVGYTEVILGVATWDFQKVYGTISPLMTIYRGWYAVREPELILWPNQEEITKLAAKIDYPQLIRNYDTDPDYRDAFDQMVCKAGATLGRAHVGDA